MLWSHLPDTWNAVFVNDVERINHEFVNLSNQDSLEPTDWEAGAFPYVRRAAFRSVVACAAACSANSIAKSAVVVR